MESATKEGTVSVNTGVSSPSSSSLKDDAKTFSSRDWTASRGSEVEQDTERPRTKRSSETALVVESPSDIKADEELHQSAKAATVSVITVLAISMILLLLHVGRTYLDARPTEAVDENFTIVVPEAEDRTPPSWPTLKPLPFTPPATERDSSATEASTMSEPKDLSPKETEMIVGTLPSEEPTDDSSTILNTDSTPTGSSAEELTTNSPAPEQTTDSITSSAAGALTSEPISESTTESTANAAESELAAASTTESTENLAQTELTAESSTESTPNSVQTDSAADSTASQGI